MRIGKKQLSKSEMKMVYGSDIRRARDEKCLTQSYMAAQLGIGQSAYQKMEADEVKISMERLVQIASILGKPLEAFLTSSGKNDTEQEKAYLSISKRELEMMEKTLVQQEKRILELEEKVKRKDDKIKELKLKVATQGS